MKNKIAFVAVGQAGGNIGQLFEEKGFNVLYINTSLEDLDTLERAKYKYHIPNGEGCNKDRRKAKQLVIDDFDQIAAKIEATIKAEQIFVIFASGGGTGSGAGPMLIDLLIDEGRNIGAVTVIPAQSESVKAHINSYDCFSELTEIAGMGACFILDNDRAEKMSINQEFVKDFCSFLEIPEKHKSVKGNIDKAEVMETLKAHGMALVVSHEAQDSAEVIKAIQNNHYAPIEPDRAVKYIAASMSGSVEMSDLEKAIGTPIDNFQTFNDDLTICCLSGLTYPQTRLEVVYNKVSDNKDTIKKNLAATMETGMKKGINFLDDLEPVAKTKEVRKPQTKRDIMSKYL
jgi:cell division GTPase FtsZ